MVVQLNRRLEAIFGLPLPTTLTFDHPTIESLTEYIATDVLFLQKPVAAPRAFVRPEIYSDVESDSIAIVGMGCRFPGGIVDPDVFWEVLREGQDVITEVPGERWDVESYYDPDPEAVGKMVTRWGGFIRGVGEFDALFFSISPREAMSMDPQQRLLLEVAWEALEDAGQAVEKLAGSKTGVFIGISTTDYAYLQIEIANDVYAGIGNAI